MLIITTAISGSRRKDYLQNLKKYAKQFGKRVKLYDVGQMMLEHSNSIGINLTPENILNAPPSVISAVRSAVFEKIAGELPRELKKNHAVFINIHAMFFWRKVFIRAWDNYYVSQLNPDLFLSFVDDVMSIDIKLKERPQWKKEKMTMNDILLWRNVDTEMTASWAEMHRKPFYSIPSQSNVKLLYRIIFEPGIEKVYVAMPLTNFMGAEGQKEVDRFIEKLEKYFIIFDPREVEMVEQWSPSMRTPRVLHQIVNRDMYWFVKQVDKVIAYFPKAVSSPGVVNELREAHETNKEAWLVYPKGSRVSPFLAYYSNMVFKGPNDLFRFLSPGKIGKKIKRSKSHSRSVAKLTSKGGLKKKNSNAKQKKNKKKSSKKTG